MEKRNAEVEVSVIIITYNHERYIRQCLDSVLNQEVDFTMEILISDDASTDGTVEILKQYAERYSNLIHLNLRKENVGPTRNSYDLLMQAKGKYLANCEGDDFWCDNKKLQLQYDFMEQHPEYIGCTHKIRLVDKEGNQQKKQSLYWVGNKEVFKLKDFQGIFLPGHLSSLFRRNIYLSGEDFSIQYSASRNIGDRTVALIYLARGDFYQIDRVMGCYRRVAAVGENNVSSRLYVRNENSVKIDFEYTKKLEEYARIHIKQKVDFDYHKCELLIRAFHTKTDYSLCKSIYKDIENKRMIVLCIMKILWKKIREG